MRRWFRTTAIAAGIVITVALLALALIAAFGDAAVTAARFATSRDDHTARRAFLGRMPKGADLHVHLSGAVYAEDMIAWATAKDLCVRLADMTITPPPCDADTTPPVGKALADQNLYDDIVNALSMRFFVPSAATPAAHDQFFGAFGKFGDVTWRIPAEMTAERLKHYAADAVQHTELMVSFFSGQQRARLIDAMRGETHAAARLAALKAGDLDAIIVEVRKQIAELTEKVEAELACDAARTKPGCAVSYRYIAQVNRNAKPEDVFVQTALAAALIRAEPHVAGLNFVGPEDYRIAREDYSQHMAMIGFLASDVPVALHAGELWLGLVPPGDLAFHIRAAVEVAGARRIGHGVALAFERRSDALLADMRKKPVVVEINLTSNDLILNVRGKDHPLPAYRAAGVPIVLSTDDAGVSRIDLTNEYFRAARDYRLGYRELKEIARNSLTYSFLRDIDKQAALERFDKSAAEFERAVAGERSVSGNMATLIRSLFAR
jgi:hypothetical protein